MEANCRFSISGRCPEVSRMEKSIPLRVDRIWFKDDRARINHIEYDVYLKEPKTNLSQKLWSNNMQTPKHQLTFEMYNSKTNVLVEKQFSKNYGVEVASRKVIEYFLGGRNNIRVKRLTILDDGSKTMQYLFGLSNMKVSVLECFRMGLPTVHPLIQSPLKELRFTVSHPTDFENPIVQTAETILIRDYGYDEPDICILELIEYWRETRRVIGWSFSILKPNGDPIGIFMENIKERFQGTYVELKETSTKKVFYVKAVSIKVDSESKIVIYGGETYYNDQFISSIVIKMMDVGSSAEISKIMEKSIINPSNCSQIEKSVPLRVKEILLSDNSFSINDIKYKAFFEVPRMRIIYTLLPIKGRSNIHVQQVTVFDNGETVQYLFGLSNLKVNVLEYSDFDVPIFHPLVERSPLKELHFSVSHPSDFENPLVRTAETILIIDYYYEERDNWLETHRNLPNKEVIIRTDDHGFTDISILELIEYWRETRRVIGSSFSILKPYGDSIEKFMENVKERFQGTYVELKATNTKTFFNINAVSIKIDSESKIVVYGGKTDYWPEGISKVEIKVMAVGSSADIQEEKTEPLEEPKIVPRMHSNYNAIVTFLLTLLIAYFFCLVLDHFYHFGSRTFLSFVFPQFNFPLYAD
ncbi:unnamed protein product [Caenorhabditis nigoni]